MSIVLFVSSSTTECHVFLSWSGGTSQQVGSLLRDFLSTVIQGLEPFMSNVDIAAGAEWWTSIVDAHNSSDAVIAVFCSDNLDRQWLHFECGAAAFRFPSQAFIPLLVDVSPTDIGPASIFQAREVLNQEHMLSVVERLTSIAGVERPFAVASIKKAFLREWDGFHDGVRTILDDLAENEAATNGAGRPSDPTLSDVVKSIDAVQATLNKETLRASNIVGAADPGIRHPPLAPRRLVREQPKSNPLLDETRPAPEDA